MKSAKKSASIFRVNFFLARLRRFVVYFLYATVVVPATFGVWFGTMYLVATDYVLLNCLLLVLTAAAAGMIPVGFMAYVDKHKMLDNTYLEYMTPKYK